MIEVDKGSLLVHTCLFQREKEQLWFVAFRTTLIENPFSSNFSFEYRSLNVEYSVSIFATNIENFLNIDEHTIHSSDRTFVFTFYKFSEDIFHEKFPPIRAPRNHLKFIRLFRSQTCKSNGKNHPKSILYFQDPWKSQLVLKLGKSYIINVVSLYNIIL